MKFNEVPIELLKTRLTYDAAAGTITRTFKNGVSESVGHIGPRGYCIVSVTHDGRNMRLRAHRVAWALFHDEWPSAQLDHRNRIKTDNRIDNLRLSDPRMNRHNCLPLGEAGHLFVTRHARGWQSTVRTGNIRHRGKVRTEPTEAAIDAVHIAHFTNVHARCSDLFDPQVFNEACERAGFDPDLMRLFDADDALWLSRSWT